MGLNRNAMVRRIKPFFGEYVTRTAMPRMPIIPLTSLRSIAEQEMIPMQISENRSIASVTGAVRFLKISFIWRDSNSRVGLSRPTAFRVRVAIRTLKENGGNSRTMREFADP